MLDMVSREAVLKDASSPEYYENVRWAYLGRQRGQEGTKDLGLVGKPPAAGQEKYGNELWEFSPEWNAKAHAFAKWAQEEFIKIAKTHQPRER
jgi:hypothetical protein